MQGRHGGVGRGGVWDGMDWQDAQRRSGHGVVRQGLAGLAGSGRARNGVDRRDTARHGKAGMAGKGRARIGMARRGTAGNARR